MQQTGTVLIRRSVLDGILQTEHCAIHHSQRRLVWRPIDKVGFGPEADYPLLGERSYMDGIASYN